MQSDLKAHITNLSRVIGDTVEYTFKLDIDGKNLGSPLILREQHSLYCYGYLLIYRRTLAEILEVVPSDFIDKRRNK